MVRSLLLPDAPVVFRTSSDVTRSVPSSSSRLLFFILINHSSTRAFRVRVPCGVVPAPVEYTIYPTISPSDGQKANMYRLSSLGSTDPSCRAAPGCSACFTLSSTRHSPTPWRWDGSGHFRRLRACPAKLTSFSTRRASLVIDSSQFESTQRRCRFGSLSRISS